MGMTYDELSTFGICRKVLKLGPFGMFQRLVHDWKDKLNPFEVATKVKVGNIEPSMHYTMQCRGSSKC